MTDTINIIRQTDGAVIIISANFFHSVASWCVKLCRVALTPDQLRNTTGGNGVYEHTHN